MVSEHSKLCNCIKLQLPKKRKIIPVTSFIISFTLLYKVFSSLFLNASFQKKSSDKSAFLKLCADFVCGERKERKKGNLLLCHLD